MPPWKESMEAILMILPPWPCSIITLAAAWERKKTVLRLMSMTSSQSFSEKAMASARFMMPALFTRMSMRPNSFLAVAMMPGIGSRLMRSALIWT